MKANSSFASTELIIELLEDNRVLREHLALAKKSSRLLAVFDLKIINY